LKRWADIEARQGRRSGRSGGGKVESLREMLGETTFWSIFVLLCTTVTIALWWLYMLRIARLPFRWVVFVPVLLLVPTYLVAPLMILALVAALFAKQPGFYTNFRYYLVAMVFGSARAASIYGERSVLPSDYLSRKFKKLGERATAEDKPAETDRPI